MGETVHLREIYFDNSSTTKLCENALKSMEKAFKFSYANPSSLHMKGFESENILNIAYGIESLMDYKNQIAKEEE